MPSHLQLSIKRTRQGPAQNIAGVDHISLDNRKFEISKKDIKELCQHFSIGRPLRFKKEKDIQISHSNFFVFIETSQGQYALKFYPLDAAKTIIAEFNLNQLLQKQHFKTPAMNRGIDGKHFLKCQNRLATCYAYVKGQLAYERIAQSSTLTTINSTLVLLKKELSNTCQSIPFEKQENMLTRIKILSQISKDLDGYDHKEAINKTLLEACKDFKVHQKLFTRQVQHNNAHLTNFIFTPKTVYTLDLTHIKEDYILSDLTSLITSSLFFKAPQSTVKKIIRDYFKQDQLDNAHLLVLKNLIQIDLVKEYLKNVQREQSIKVYNQKNKITQHFKSQIITRKKLILSILKKINEKRFF